MQVQITIGILGILRETDDNGEPTGDINTLELAEMLRTEANRIEYGDVRGHRIIMDVNGNAVGEMTVLPDDAEDAYERGYEKGREDARESFREIREQEANGGE